MRGHSKIAIVGISCHFPRARDAGEFWRILCNGVEGISNFTSQEISDFSTAVSPINTLSFVEQTSAGREKSKVLSENEFSNADFLGFSDQLDLDPQYGVFLENALKALEDAGYDVQTYEGLIGVYTGIDFSNYSPEISNKDISKIEESTQVSLTANFKDCLSSKVSSILNLKGPSVSIQTDCSTSLVAIHMASLSLAIGECDMALAGGVSLQVPERADVSYQDGSAVQGTVFSGGAGIVILKRLADAIADRDYIYAVIKGTAINHNGFKHPSNQTTPSVAAQTAVISKAQSIAGVAPETISYIETDAAVTELGNSVEMAALTQAFTTSAHRKGVCAVGSLRTSLGHLGAATGVASLIKVVLALKHKQIPPSLNWEQSSSQIDSSSSPFYINTELSPWETDASRNAGVSSFSRGGTNVYMVLEEAPIAEISEADRPWQLLVLSAKTSSALEKATVNLAEHLKQHPNLSLANAAYTLQIGRQVFDHRKMLVCQSLDDAVTVLESPDSQNPPKARRKFTRYQPPCHRPIVFMFSGQGTQYLNMARELYEVEAIFQEIVDICSDLLRPHLGLDLRRILYPEPEQFEEVSQQLKQTAITQPALFVIEYALAKLWMKWGIEPVATIGHSIGEYVAATLAGVFSLEDALALVSARGQLMQQLPSGSMLAVALPEEEVRSFLSSPLSIAAVNAPSMCTVSGATDAIEALQSELDSQEVDYRPLHTSHAFHSEMMEPILSSFSERVKQVPRKPPQIPYVSNITGTWITPEEAVDPEYWASHIRQTVRFSQGLQELFKVPNQVLLEVGPGQALSKLAKRHKSQVKSQIVLNSVRHPREQCSDEAFLLKTLGHLWLVGVTVDWSEFYASKQLYRLPLPTYPFEDRRYQIEQQKKSHLEQQNETSLSAAHP